MSLNAIEFGADGIMKWEQVSPPLWWPAARCHIVADRHLPDGTRQHMVESHVAAGLVINHAMVIGRQDATGAEFASCFSHLSNTVMR